MSDAERITLVERWHLDVWYGDAREEPGFSAPVGWVVDSGDPDGSLWSAVGDGGSTLAVGQPTWRAAVDAAADALRMLGLIP